jgi:hypothetical protein
MYTILHLSDGTKRLICSNTIEIIVDGEHRLRQDRTVSVERYETINDWQTAIKTYERSKV